MFLLMLNVSGMVISVIEVVVNVFKLLKLICWIDFIIKIFIINSVGVVVISGIIFISGVKNSDSKK